MIPGNRSLSAPSMEDVEHMRQDVDIARNRKTIEWLKAEMTGAIAALFRAMVNVNSDRMLDSLAALVLNSYLLGKRIGFQAEKIDQAILAKLTENIDKGHEIEKWYGDLSDLQRHLTSKRR